MQNDLARKSLVLAVIVLFVGVAIAPGMSAVNLKMRSVSKEAPFINEIKDDELVEITVSLCKSDGMQNYTVMLTKKQAEELDVLIDNFKKELDKAETMEETIALYRDMVISLDELGLLPEDIGVEETQQLVTGNNYVVNHSEYENIFAEFRKQLSSKEKQEEMITLLNEAVVELDDMGLLPEGMSVEDAQELVAKRFHEIFDNTIVSEMENALELDDNENFFCLISGELDFNHFFAGRGALFFLRILRILFFFGEFFYPIIWDLFGFDAAWEFANFIMALEIFPIMGYLVFLVFSDLLNPSALGNIIYMGSSLGWGRRHASEPWEPAKGEIFTNGLNGTKNWNGKFYGHLPLGTLWLYRWYGHFLYEVQYYPGISGFTGIKIVNEETYETFFLGFALWVKIGPNPPGSSENQGELELPVMNPYSGMQNSLIGRQGNNPYVGVGGMNE